MATICANTSSGSISRIGWERGVYSVSLIAHYSCRHHVNFLFHSTLLFLFFPPSNHQRWTFLFHFTFTHRQIVCHLHLFRLSLTEIWRIGLWAPCNGALAIATAMICGFNYRQILCTVKVLSLQKISWFHDKSFFSFYLLALPLLPPDSLCCRLFPATSKLSSLQTLLLFHYGYVCIF